MAILAKRGPITQRFGQKSKYDIYSKGINWGTDFAVPTGTRVSLPNGQWKVVESFSGAKAQGPNNRQRGANRGYGNSVLVENTETNERLRFSHLSQVIEGLEKGMSARGGTTVGFSGATGNVAGKTGQHLDVEYYKKRGVLADITKSSYARQLFDKIVGSAYAQDDETDREKMVNRNLTENGSTSKSTTMNYDINKIKNFYNKMIEAGHDAKETNAFIKDKLAASKEEAEEAEEEFQPEAEVPGGPLPPSYGESVPGQADARAIMRLRRDIQKPENFEDLMRRYGKTFGGELEDSQVREEYNAYQGQEGKWGEAKESEAEVEALKSKTGVTEMERAEFTSQLLGQVETYTSREEALRDFGIYKKAMEEMGVDSKLVLDAIDKKFPEEEKKKNKVLFDLPKFFKKGAEEQVKNPLKPTPFRIYG